ncbi:CPBP family intramembrane metalloprotease [Streptococcus sp. 16.1]|uniref:CAAX protease n=1 Tax=Streptococcus salivarius TaxID=1304 RepID=A0A074IXY8_STRSL|nr:CAAX protease [Streptococcus salivarius]KEO46549.1 CAAX protease [Streptococcus salivarius]MBK5025700.1 CPBP family intramembrane metalloprotease [Streptococcus sp. 17.1]MBK5034552.1 CPBP family intramembrane metalloprotease [Streptococcus sp. 15.1]MBK5141550.1 CPBP family intramembrane metalloprotease [Streptococcus sp. 16.1]
MSLLKKIHPEQSLKELRWFDIAIVTLIMFGQFIVRSTQMYLASLTPSLSTAVSETATNTASEGAAYSSNFTLQIILLALAIIYLWIRHFDFKQLPIRLKWSVLFWVPFIFAIMGLFADMVSTLSGQYNYFSPQVLAFISPMAVIDKFMALSPMAIAYGLLNGFYEEFFFLGLLTSVKDKYKWLVLLFSTIVRVSFHTYQGMLWALVIGVVFGLLYYYLYEYPSLFHRVY